MTDNSGAQITKNCINTHSTIKLNHPQSRATLSLYLYLRPTSITALLRPMMLSKKSIIASLAVLLMPCMSLAQQPYRPSTTDATVSDAKHNRTNMGYDPSSYIEYANLYPQVSWQSSGAQTPSTQLNNQPTKPLNSPINSPLNTYTPFDTSLTTQSSAHSASLSTVPTAPKPLQLPDLGNGSNRFVEQHEHKAVGEWSLRQLHAQAPLLTDPWIQEELTRLTWALNSQVRLQAPLALMVIDNPNINAFAIPGGVIGINTGTVLAANSMDEVASVLAHEVAHLSQRHYEHRSDADAKALLVQMATLIAGAAAASVDSNAATAIMMGGQTAAQNSRMAFSRSNEREADRIGMQIMAQSGYDPRAMPRFFATLNARSELNSSANSFLPSFIMTHPLSSERLSEAQTRANQYPSATIYKHKNRQAGSLSQDALFDLLKWRTAVVSNQAQETSLLSVATQSAGARLALATFYANKGRYASANSTLATFDAMPAIQKQSYEPLLSITKAHIASRQGQWNNAVQLLQRQHDLYPERRDLRLYLADTLLRLPISEDTQAQIERLLAPLVAQVPHDIEALMRLQFAYEKIATHQLNNDSAPEFTTLSTIKALRYRSQRELWQAEYDKAQKSLQQAKQLATGLQGSRINPSALLVKIEGDIKVLQDTQAFTP